MSSARQHATNIELGEHRLGRFDRRMPIGPACWEFHDLLWVHEGEIRLSVGGGAPVRFVAPGGLLILPGTPFEGGTFSGFATASIYHFRWPEAQSLGPGGPGYLVPRAEERLYVQSMLRLSLSLAEHSAQADPERRRRLLLAILDCFDLPASNQATVATGRDERLDVAWRQAAAALGKVRSLSDVASFMGVHESALRARHRDVYRTSAGSHLRELRLRRAEDLLATSRFSIGEIAQQVGYGHAETFIASFRRSRGCTPGQFRHRSNPFA